MNENRRNQVNELEGIGLTAVEQSAEIKLN